MKPEQILHKTENAFGESADIGIYALAAAVNALAADGGRFFLMSAQTYLPLSAGKAKGYAIEKRIKKTCREREITVEELRIRQSAAVGKCMTVTSGVAHREWEPLEVHAGQDIVLTGSVGLEGTLRILGERKRELQKRFAPVFLSQIEELETSIWAVDAIRTAQEMGASLIRQIGDGGIFGALYRLSEETGFGLEADIRKMSVRQETIEVCEHFRLNPYQLTSAGSMLMLADDGEGLVCGLCDAGREAAVIGTLKDNKDKIIRNGEEMRYIDRPAPDEINKIITFQ